MTLQLFHCEQGSAEWHRVRLGIPTASEFASILAKGEGKMRRTYLMKLLGERFTGEPAEDYSNAHMERGKAMEAEARAHYAFQHDTDPVLVGFIRNANKGCSPDSLIGKNGLVEIKTKTPHRQLEVIFAGKLPSEHQAQVQGSLWVSEREFEDFVSYWPKLPLFVKRIYRDDKFIEGLAAEVTRFNEELDTLTELMIRNGAVRVTA